NFGSRQAAQIRETVAQTTADADHALDVADAILKADQVGAAFCKDFQMFGVQTAERSVVDDDAEINRFANLFDMGHYAGRAGFCQVMRQQQDAVCAQALGFLRVSDGLPGGATRAGNYRYLARAGSYCGGNDLAVLLGFQGEKLARSA